MGVPLRRDRDLGERAVASVSADGMAPGLMAMYSDPPWSLRAHWLAGLAWLPMLTVVLVQLTV